MIDVLKAIDDGVKQHFHVCPIEPSVFQHFPYDVPIWIVGILIEYLILRHVGASIGACMAH